MCGVNLPLALLDLCGQVCIHARSSTPANSTRVHRWPQGQVTELTQRAKSMLSGQNCQFDRIAANSRQLAKHLSHTAMAAVDTCSIVYTGCWNVHMCTALEISMGAS